MKKNEIVTAIVAAYDLQLELTPEQHTLAQDVLVKNEDGKKIRTTAPALQTLLDAINGGAAADEAPVVVEPAAEPTTSEKLDAVSEGLEDWSDAEMDAKIDADTAAKVKAKKEKKAAAAAKKAAKPKADGATAKSVLSGPGAVIVGTGLAIFTTWKGTRFDATLLADGKVVMAGTTYSSPFNAYNKGIGAYRNGWKLWTFVNAEGAETAIDALRENSKGFKKGATRSGAAGIANKIEKRFKKIERLARELAEAKDSLKVLKASLKEAQKAEKEAAKAQKKSA